MVQLHAESLARRVCEEGHFTERQAAIVLQQLLSGVAYLHAHGKPHCSRKRVLHMAHWSDLHTLAGIVHRDIKLENLLLADSHRDCLSVRLADFGLAKSFDPGSPLRTMCGSRGYVAPEVLTSQHTTKVCAAVADLVQPASTPVAELVCAAVLLTGCRRVERRGGAVHAALGLLSVWCCPLPACCSSTCAAPLWLTPAAGADDELDEPTMFARIKARAGCTC